MDLADIASLRRRLFREKRSRLEELLDVPLLLYWGKWEGPNIRALTLAEEFTRPTFFLCARGGETVAFVQKIETDQLAALAEEIDVIPYRTTSELKDELGARLGRYDEVAVEASTDFFALDRFPPNYLSFVSAVVKVREGDDVLVPFRAVKSPLELALMKKASVATMAGFAELEEIIRPGVSEEEVLDYLLHKALDAGDGPAYFPIVASGPRSQHPHPYRRSKKEVEAGERVVVDYGVDVLGYKADVTRTYVAGGEPGDDPYYGISLELAELVRNADLSKITPLELGRPTPTASRRLCPGWSGLLRTAWSLPSSRDFTTSGGASELKTITSSGEAVPCRCRSSSRRPDSPGKTSARLRVIFSVEGLPSALA
jgi:hypothetical protein